MVMSFQDAYRRLFCEFLKLLCVPQKSKPGLKASCLVNHQGMGEDDQARDPHVGENKSKHIGYCSQVVSHNRLSSFLSSFVFLFAFASSTSENM